MLAQESGLVLVIVLLMVLLTVAGGTKPSIDRTPVPASAQVKSDDRTITVTENGVAHSYAVADGWDLRGPDDNRFLTHRHEVNKFLDLQNLFINLVYASFIAVMAVAMTAVIAMGGIDLSIGSTYALSALFGAMALRWLQARALGVPYDGDVTSAGGAGMVPSVLLGLAVCCGVGALSGMANGLLIVGLRVHPFLITLGTMAAFRGWVAIPTSAQSFGPFPEAFTTKFFRLEVHGINPVPVAVMLVVTLAGIFMLNRTVLGRRVYAIGGNEIAARYAGIPVGRVKVIIYTLMGLLAGLSACLYLGYLGAAETNAGNGYELKVIAAAVIGGASLSGGRGTALGAVLGALLIQLIDNGMLILNIDQNYNQIVMGTAIILAVVLDQLKTRYFARGA